MKTLSTLFFLLLFYSTTIFSQITIAGTIANECGEPIPAVDVLLEDLSTTPITEYQAITSFNGNYSFDALPSGHDWRLTPSRTTTDLCGIDADDIADISAYFIGDYTKLTSEYARIATDADDNSTMSALDMIEIQRFILGISNGFSVNWRFVDADFTFPPPVSLNAVNHAFPSTIAYEGLTQDELENDFIAIKTGDVNCSYDNACDESFDCGAGCRMDVIPSVALCPAEFIGTQLVIPVTYYAPNGVTSEDYEFAVFNVNVFDQNVLCLTIDQTATEASGPNVSVSGNIVTYNTGLNLTTLTNGQVLFNIVVDGSPDCCFTPEISNARFFYDLANFVDVNTCEGDEYCLPSTEIRGTVEVLTGGTRPVDNVSLRIVDEFGNTYCEGLETDQFGQYSCDVFPGLTYTITPYRNDAHCEGLTSGDIGLVSSSTLSPYAQISADVNDDGLLNFVDGTLIFSVMTCGVEEFPNNNTSWRFVDAAYDWSFSADPPLAQDFPEEIVLPTLDVNSAAFYRADFVGMKIGDINGSCPTCGPCCESAPPGEGLGRFSEYHAIDQEGKLWDDLTHLVQQGLTDEQFLSLESGQLVSKVYPNPFVDNITLDIFSMYASDATLRLFDVTGKVVGQSALELEEGMNTYGLIHLGDLPTGIYYSQVLVGTHTMVNKVIKF